MPVARLPRPIAASLAAALLAVAAAGLSTGCGPGDEAVYEEPAVHHPLAVRLQPLRSLASGVPADVEILDHFLKYAGTSASAYEVRRACGAAGRCLRAAPPEKLAEFAAGAAKWLYDDFFREIDSERVAQIAGGLDDLGGTGEIARLRIGSVLRNGGGLYQGSLESATELVAFEDAVAPRPLALERILPGPESGPEAFTGAAEILRVGAFVGEGEQRDLAVETCRRGLGRWPEDRVLAAGLVLVYLEAGDRYADELAFFLGEIEALDAENAAWPCIRAARAFRLGRDEEALSALRVAIGRPVLTFYDIQRAKAAAGRLAALGYGPIQARLAAWRATSVTGWLLVKDLANRAIERTYEYEAANREDDLRLVLELPRMLDRQVQAAPRTTMAEVLSGRILAAGLTRLADHHRTKTPGLAQNLDDRAREAADRVAMLEKAERQFAGPAAWARFYEELGEEAFLAYLDGVVFANEGGFLVECAKQESPEAVLALARRPHPFE